MPKVTKPTKQLSGDQVSSSQRDIAELLNPEIEEKRFKAIAKSPKVNVDEQIDTEHIPEFLLIEISNAGLTEELKRIPKCKLTFYRKKPIAREFCRFVAKYGKVQPHF